MPKFFGVACSTIASQSVPAFENTFARLGTLMGETRRAPMSRRAAQTASRDGVKHPSAARNASDREHTHVRHVNSDIVRASCENSDVTNSTMLIASGTSATDAAARNHVAERIVSPDLRR